MPTSVHNNDILTTLSLDAVVVGAGFAGLYQLYSLREKLELDFIDNNTFLADLKL